MEFRTRQTTVHFNATFKLPGLDMVQPAGDYRVDHDEEQIENVSRQAWRRIDTIIHLPAINEKGSKRQMLSISPSDLDAAIERDRQ